MGQLLPRTVVAVFCASLVAAPSAAAARPYGAAAPAAPGGTRVVDAGQPAQPTAEPAACDSGDNGRPHLDSLSFSPRVLDVRRHAQQVHIVATAADEGGPGPATGIRSVRVTALGLTRLGSPIELSPAPDGTWRATRAVPRGWHATRLRAQSADIVDGAGLFKQYFGKELSGPLGAVATVLTRPDRRRPDLLGFTMDHRVADSRRHAVRVRFSVRAADPGSGVGSVHILTPSLGEVFLRRVSGTPARGRWVGSLLVRRFAPAQPSPRVSVFVSDAVGNSLGLDTAQLAARGLPSTLRVVSRRDPTAPTLTIRSVTRTVDLREHDGQLELLVHAVDPQSGLDVVGIDLDEDDLIALAGHLVSGTRRDGLWRIVLPYPRCSTRPAVERHVLYGLNRHFTSAKPQPLRIQILASDVFGPRITPSTVQVVGASGPVAVRFDEDVTGLTDRAALIQTSDPNGDGTPSGPPIPGTWACATAAGAPADCASGVWRSAAWTPAGPLGRGTYLVTLNPEGVLDLSDTLGNPARSGPPSFRVAT